MGYDVRDRLLIVNDTEAKLVRRIFDDFVTLRSATLMAKAYGAEGAVTKSGNPASSRGVYGHLWYLLDQFCPGAEPLTGIPEDTVSVSPANSYF